MVQEFSVMKKSKILFLYSIENEDYFKDGLWAAIELLKKDFNITKHNLHNGPPPDKIAHESDFLLGWGAFGSPADNYVKDHFRSHPRYKKGLCIAGNAISPQNIDAYDILFYETEWYAPQISSHKNIIHAFGVNTDIFKPNPDAPKLWDFLTVGAFATWKRQALICAKFGSRMAIGEIQKDNIGESVGIVGKLIISGCGVSDMVKPEVLVNFYNAARTVYIPADINGGGERAVLEARACGIPVEIEVDNFKLKELLTSSIWDQKYYAKQLKKGILSCL